MASTIDRIKNDIIKALNASQKKTSAYDTEAEVVRVEGNTAWVHIGGGVPETPVALTINAQKGDKVQVRVSNEGAWIMGNSTAPPTDDTTAIMADRKASEVRGIAIEAQEVADNAFATANSAMQSANGKNTIYYGASEPTGGTYKTGDTWFNAAEDNAIYMWNGASWTKEELGEDAIANLSITNAKIANGTIQNGKIANLDAAKITSGDIDANRMKTNAVSAINATVDKIDAKNVNVSQITIGQSQVTNLTTDLSNRPTTTDMTTAIDNAKQIKTDTASGSIATFTGSKYPAVSVVTDIEPIQDLHGYGSPWVGGAGKNKLDTSNMSTATASGVTFSRASDGTITIGGKATANVYRTIGSIQTENGVSYTITGTPSGGASGKYRMTVGGYGYDYGNGYTFTGDGNSHGISIDVYTGYPSSGTLTFKPMVRLASETDATYVPYENICPISGRTEVNTIVSPTTSASAGNTYTTPLGRTVYGGTLDVTTGVLTVDRAMLTLNTANMNNSEAYPGWANSGVRALVGAGLNRTFYSATINVGTVYGINTNGSYDILFLPTSQYGKTQTEWKALAIDVQAIIELATPQTYSVSPQQIELLQGTNNLWTDCGDVNVTYAIISADAVEALNNPIDGASKVATSYITQIDNGGIKVHDAGDTSNYSKIDSNGMKVYQNNNEVASFGSNLIELGKNSVDSVINLCNDAGSISASRSDNINYLNILGVTPSSSYRQSNLHITPLTRLPGTEGYYPGCYIDMYNYNGSETTGSSITLGVQDRDDYTLATYLFLEAGRHMEFLASDYSSDEAHFSVECNNNGISGPWIGFGRGGVNHGLYSQEADTWIAMSDGTYNYTGTNFGPYETSTSTSTGYYLGWTQKRWRQLYSYSSPNVVSDRKHKDIIGNIDYAKELIMGLEPVEFQWKDSDHKRSHMGFIAQDSAEVAKSIGKDLSFYEAQYIDGSDYHGEEADDNDLQWGMMYTELIAPLVKVVQEQQSEIEELKAKVEELERR